MEFTSSEHCTPPDPGELEISLFGPGVGECVVVHLGSDHWVVVDSCVNPRSRNPIALDYLAALGVDPATGIREVVATHFHDDHVGGLHALLDAARAASFVMSAALCCNEFLELVAASGRHMSRTHSSGLDELRLCLGTLTRARAPGTRLSAQGPVYALAGRSLLHLEIGPIGVEVRALSPSDASLTRAVQALGRLVPTPGAPSGTSLPNPGPNECSVALWICAGEARALLGSDLEQGSNTLIGWRGVVGAAGAPTGAQAYKVAHHGSANADHEEIWSRLCAPAPIAMVTPFRRSGLPRSADVERLQIRTPHLYCASDPVPPARPPARPREVERTIKEVTLHRRVVERRMGHVRVRMPHAGGAPSRTELFGDARALTRPA